MNSILTSDNNTLLSVPGPVAKNVSFVVPCYNEEPSVLRDLIASFKATFDSLDDFEYELIIVNDGSSKFSYDDPPEDNVRLINHRINRGYGASLVTGISHAVNEWIGIIDADGTYPVESFPELLTYTGDFDMIVGKRSWKNIQPLRRLPKYILTLTASFLADFPIPDLNSGMRLFKKEIVRKFIKVFPSRFSFSSTLTMVCIGSFYRIHFVDIPYFKRIGSSNIQPINDTIRFFTLIFRLSLYMNPLRFFVPLSVVSFVIAILRTLRDIIVTGHIGNLALILFLMAFQIFFFGLIAEIINKK